MHDVLRSLERLLYPPQLSCASVSTLPSSPVQALHPPQQDILKLAGTQCQYLVRPQAAVQTWKLHHWKEMVLFQRNWSAATLAAESRSTRNFCSFTEEVRRHVNGHEASPDGETLYIPLLGVPIMVI